jgi:hypothetical protein
MSNTATVAAPVETDQLTTHRFRGGPYDQFIVTFPRRSLLDDPNVHFLIIPKNTSLETGLAWGEITGQESSPGPMPGYAVYRRNDDGTWHYIPLSESLPTRMRRCR